MMNDTKKRYEFLAKVSTAICSDRNNVHGDPEDNFNRIAKLWTTYLDKDISARDVAAMMCLFKVARLANNIDNADSWLDIAGYAVCGGSLKKA